VVGPPAASGLKLVRRPVVGTPWKERRAEGARAGPDGETAPRVPGHVAYRFAWDGHPGARSLANAAPVWLFASGRATRTLRARREHGMKIDGNVAAVVTGGASGLGAATARRLAAAGARVALFDLSEEAGNAVAQEISATFHAVDVTREESLIAGFEAARAANGVARVLVNCAGIAPVAKTVSRGAAHPFDMFAKVIDVNLVGTFRACALFALAASALDPVTGDGERGVIVNTASVAAFDGQIGQLAYAASKGGVASMTLPLARDLSQYGIRVVTIAPGIFETPMLLGLGEKVVNSLGEQVPFPKRLGRPEEYADLAMAIVGNSLLNGEVIRLDGAIRMGPR